jgi:hypothetical protein
MTLWIVFWYAASAFPTAYMVREGRMNQNSWDDIYYSPARSILPARGADFVERYMTFAKNTIPWFEDERWREWVPNLDVAAESFSNSTDWNPQDKSTSSDDGEEKDRHILAFLGEGRKGQAYFGVSGRG